MLHRSVLMVALAATGIAQAQTKIQWQGYTWYVKDVASEGPGPNAWSKSNVSVDAAGNLHLKISKTNNKWSCAEIWTDKPLGFGEYQCQVEGQLDQLDPNVIFSMFSYDGPDGVNEIDIEYAKWGNPKEKNCWWTVYPTGGTKNIQQKSYGFDFKLNGTYTTSRYNWSKTNVFYWMFGGFQQLTANGNKMDDWNFEPKDTQRVPQSAMPLHFNLWLFQGKAPTNGKPVEIIVHQFRYLG